MEMFSLRGLFSPARPERAETRPSSTEHRPISDNLIALACAVGEHKKCLRRRPLSHFPRIRRQDHR